MSRIKDLEDLLDANPDDPFIIYALAREHEAQFNTMQAVLMYEYLINNHPAYIASYYHYSKLLYEAGNRTQALALLKRGIEEGIKEKDLHSVGEMKSLIVLWTGDDEEE